MTDARLRVHVTLRFQYPFRPATPSQPLLPYRQGRRARDTRACRGASAGLPTRMTALDETSSDWAQPTFSLRHARSLLESRDGSVLARGTILKTDHFRTGRNELLEYHLLGAPNFRRTELNVYGVAQPALPGLCTMLTLLGCAPKRDTVPRTLTPMGVGTRITATASNTTVAPVPSASGSASRASPAVGRGAETLIGDGRLAPVRQSRCLWFNMREEPVIYLNGRPFVLRDSETPLKNIQFFAGISAARLEEMESRLKRDIVAEAEKYQGLILVHDELEDGQVVPCWLASYDVQTPREVYESLVRQGYRVGYHRIPISPEQAPEDNYLDSFVLELRKTDLDDPVIVNCGIGVGRSKSPPSPVTEEVKLHLQWWRPF